MDSSTAANRIARARIALLTRCPFFGMVALRWEVLFDERVGTAVTDGRILIFAPSFVDRLSDDELVGVLAHEVLHIANGHVWRRSGRDLQMWNIACDLAVNGIVRDVGLLLPEDAIECDDSRLSAEEYYSRFVHGAHVPNVCGCWNVGAVIDGETSDEIGWHVTIERAAAAAKMYGHMPDAVERIVDRMRRARVSWRDVLFEFVCCGVDRDYVFGKWNRRNSVLSSVVLPAVVPDGIGDILIAIDTSSSIKQRELQKFVAEVDAIVALCGRAHVVECNVQIQRCYDIDGHNVGTRSLRMRGEGGTSFIPVFEYAESLPIRPRVCVYLTDLFGEFPRREPEFPVLWVVADVERPEHVRRPPFGRVVLIDGV